MNKLYVSQCWIFFKTDESKKEDAVERLYEICDSVGIEIMIQRSELITEEM